MPRQYKIIRVTMDVDYWVPMADKEHSDINGWTLKQLIKSWFKDFDINSHHASREAFRLGNGTKIIQARVLRKKVVA